jgi:MoaA/NifB/PqqE/SkfB family radical SAM enzyme
MAADELGGAQRTPPGVHRLGGDWRLDRGDAFADRDLDEANRVVTMAAGHRFELQLGHLCNNRCVFCTSGKLTQRKLARAIGLAPILRAIDDARARGARHITFLGGEPTLHPGFLDALRHTVAVGFEEVVIFTNGVLLPKPGFIDAVCALGRFEWRISIQGATAEAHHAVTGRGYAFERIVQGLQLLGARDQIITANLCVNEHSYRSLPGFLPLAQRYGLRQLHVDIIRPASVGPVGEGGLQAIMPRYSAMAPAVRELVQAFDDWDLAFPLHLGNMPYCVVPEAAHRIHHGGEDTIIQACGPDELETQHDKYNWHRSLRRKVAGCAGCVFDADCSGVFGEYLELYGEAEFQAVARAELEALDPTLRGYVLLSQPWLRPLEVGAPPAGWAQVSWQPDKFQRCVEARWRGPGEATLALRVERPVPAGRAGERPERADAEDGWTTVARARRGRLRLRCEGDAAAGAAGPLGVFAAPIAWLQERLRAGELLGADEALDLGAAAAAARAAAEARAAGLRAQRIAQAIARIGRFDGWRCEAPAAAEAPGEVALRLRGPAGAQVRLAVRGLPGPGAAGPAISARALAGCASGEADAVAALVRRRLLALRPTGAAP